jgi:hypothetical protein
VVLHDVARDARLLVELAAPLDADLLGHGDLDVAHVLPRPERLEDGVAEAEDQQVLDGLFSEVVIDAVDLALVEVGEQLAVQRARALEVCPEGLLDHDALKRLVASADRGGSTRPALRRPATMAGTWSGPTAR